MNPFDLLIASVSAYCLIRGVFRGLIREAASILGVLGGFWCAYTFYPAGGRLLSGWIDDPAVRNLVAFLLLFCAVLVAVNAVALVLNYLTRLVLLGWLNRLGGLAFGAAKAVLIASILFLAFTAFLPKGSPWLRESVCAPALAVVSDRLAAVVSSEIRKEFSSRLEILKKAWTAPR